ncbi:MAG: SCO6745 family protein [Acidimicrobiales bacterium]
MEGRSPPPARDWWRYLETVHAVTYFSPESREHLRAAGLHRFWDGYFAARAAPLGAVGPAVVTALFCTFHQAMVERSLPDAWRSADPARLLRARRSGAAAALRRVAPALDDDADRLAAQLGQVVTVADGSGRALFSANRALGPVADPVERLWQACTSLREHRGDGHVAALTAAGLDGCEALVLTARWRELPDDVFRENRGWSDDDWESAGRRLRSQGLVVGGRLSSAGRRLREDLEQRTDALAAPPFGRLADEDRAGLFEGVRAVATAVVEAGIVPFPNPMGLPAPDAA